MENAFQYKIISVYIEFSKLSLMIMLFLIDHSKVTFTNTLFICAFELTLTKKTLY